MHVSRRFPSDRGICTEGFFIHLETEDLGTSSRIYNENGKLISEKFYQQMQIKGSFLGDVKLHNSFCP
jgi:hypothetical protein